MAVVAVGAAPSSLQFTARNIAPTSEQLAIQTAIDRTIIVEANAGAAKTTTLALRLAQAWNRGVDPRACLALTYTPAACEALAAALAKIGVPPPVVRQFRVETFESFARVVLAELEGSDAALKPDAQALKPMVWQAIEQVAGNARERWRDDLVVPSLGDNAAIEEFLRVDLELKGRMVLDMHELEGPPTPADAEALGVSYTWLKVFQAYEGMRRTIHAEQPTFRGPFDATYDLARLVLQGELPSTVRAWPSRPSVLVVDEMHDVNQAMHLILAKLVDASAFFVGVGDVDQVIYSAAGADAKFLHNELERSTGRRVVRYPLTASFRFDKSLARAVTRFKQKRCASESAHATTIVKHVYADEPAARCEDLLVAQVRKWKAAREKLSGFAVLLRHPHQSVALENALLAADIPYMTRGFESYLLRPEILLIRGLLAVATDRFTGIQDAPMRRRLVEAMVFCCDVKISQANLQGLSQAAFLKQSVDAVIANPVILSSFFERHVLEGVEPSVARRLRAAIALARDASGAGLLSDMIATLQLDVLAASAFVEADRRDEVRGNLRGLIRSAERYATPADFFQSLNDAEVKQRGLKSTANRVILADVASVKGLEFDHVALAYLRQGEFPNPHGASLAEDNLFYVGMTRARRVLGLYAHRDQPSAFLNRLA